MVQTSPALLQFLAYLTMFVKLAPGAVKGNLQPRILPLKTWALTLPWEVLVPLFCLICTHTWPLQAGDHRGIPFQLVPELVTVRSKGSPLRQQPWHQGTAAQCPSIPGSLAV